MNKKYTKPFSFSVQPSRLSLAAIKRELEDEEAGVPAADLRRLRFRLMEELNRMHKRVDDIWQHIFWAETARMWKKRISRRKRSLPNVKAQQRRTGELGKAESGRS